MEAVLPRVKRKRLKPPPPSFWRALAWVVADLVFFVWSVSSVPDPVSGVCAAIYATHFVVFGWPNLRRELEAWRDQD